MTPKEQAVRSAAKALQEAIADAQKAGLIVIWPRNADGLASISVSETGKATLTVTTDTTNVDAATAAAAAAAAQKAADKVVGKAK